MSKLVLKNHIFIDIWLKHEKCIQMSINIIGSVVLTIAISEFVRNILKFKFFTSYSMLIMFFVTMKIHRVCRLLVSYFCCSVYRTQSFCALNLLSASPSDILKKPSPILSTYFFSTNIWRFWYHKRGHIFLIAHINHTAEQCVIWKILMKTCIVIL